MPDCNDHLALPASLQAVPQALQWLENIAEREHWPMRTTLGLTLSLDEALANVVSYAFDPPVAAPSIIVTCRDAGGRIVVELRDNGRPHDPTTHEPAALATSLEEASLGGHGLRLMRHYLHELHYSRDGDWNRLELVILRD